MGRRLLIVATFDTKGREAQLVGDCAKRLGVEVMFMDVGTLEEPHLKPHIASHEVAAAAGFDLRQLRQNHDRVGAIKAMREGGAIVAKRFIDEDLLGGIIGMGGGTGTAIVSSIMRAVPYGVPKVLVSTVASRDVREYVGTRDIVMVHSVADILGSNQFIRHILEQATHAVCAMMKMGISVERKRPMVAVTAYGINSAPAVHAEPLLNELGYEMIAFHANGVGGTAMEEMIEDGLISGVLDFTTHEIADEMYGGYCRGMGPLRFEAAGKKKVPLLVVPGGLDNAVFSPVYPMPDALKGRKIHGHDTRFCVRMEAEEMKAFAGVLGEKLNRSGGPVFVLIPTKGWSEADKEGSELFSPETDEIFVRELKNLLKPEIPVEEVSLHISDKAFAQRAVEILDTMMKNRIDLPSDREGTG